MSRCLHWSITHRILESSALAQCPTFDFTKLGSVNNTEGRLRLVLKGTEIIPIAISALAMANKHLVEAGADFQLHAVAASLPPFNEEKACKVGKGTSYHSAAGWVLSCFRSSSKPPSARYASISAVGNVALQVAAQILIWANTSLFLGREPDTRPDPGMRPQPRISTVVVPTMMTSSAAQGDTNVEVDQMQSMLAQQQQLMSLVQAFTAGVSFGSSSHAPAHSPVQQAPPASPRQATRARYQ
ncbi:hypothetical protein HaLaN_08276 [Haematococcus lacustris]|uniref:Uncharacterized protein n=1 Tax=Haematococcus lacustris TaxID=44745 RepID=A0A699Z0M7_HAELA|nr:hypothetical protein HaLaN_08276 [Haematococcus lacustris]